MERVNVNRVVRQLARGSPANRQGRNGLCRLLEEEKKGGGNGTVADEMRRHLRKEVLSVLSFRRYRI